MAVNLTFTGDSNDAQAAIAKLERKWNELENKIKNGKKSSPADDWSASFEKFGSSILRVLGPIELVRRGVSLLKNEYDDLIDRQRKAGGVQVNFGRQFTDMALNAPHGADPVQLKKDNLQLASDINVLPSDLTRIQNAAQAARGPLSDDRVKQTLVESAKLANLSADAMESLVGASLDIQKQNPDKYSPKKTIAFALNQAAESHVKNASDYATNVMPGIGAIAGLEGTSPEFPAAVAGAMTQASGDPMGRKTRTALLALHFQLQRALPDLKTFQERVEYAQSDPEFQSAFFNGTKHKGKDLPSQDFEVAGPEGETFKFSGKAASFETQSKPFVQMALQKDSVVAKDIRRIMSTVPNMENSEASFDLRARGMAADPNMQNAQVAQRLKVDAEIARLNDIHGGKSGIVRPQLDDLMQAKGMGWADRFMFQRRVESQIGSSHEEAVMASLKHDRDYYKRLADAEDKWGDNPKHQAASRRMRSQQEAFQGFIDDISGVQNNAANGNGLQKAIEENNRLLQENNRITKEVIEQNRGNGNSPDEIPLASAAPQRRGQLNPKGNVE